MLNRKYNLKLDLQFRCNNSNMEFNQFDKNTSDFFMQINRSGKEIDLSKALVTLMVIKPNGNVDSQFLEVGKDGVYANLKPSLKNIPGDYQCKAIVTIKDETVIPDQVFTYTVNEDRFLASFNSNMATNDNYTLLTDILGRLSTIETDEQQRQINEAERIISEEARENAENTRVKAELIREHNDADREKAEATRESSEFIRKTSENSRIEAESNRVKAEKLRVNAETSRVEAENLRNDNYNFMTSDEERRRNEESARIEAENLRKQAESTRVNEESQRRSTEQARVLKEKERESKETERAANENTRKANESKRVQAETERVNRYDNFITDAESASNSFKAYTSTAKQEEETRKTNELARVKSEDVRVSNEVKRISDENTRKANEVKRVEAETVRQSKFNSKILEVDNKVVEVNVAKDTVIVDTKEAINTMKGDVANAIAAGTQDLEVKEARKDLKGKTHESLKLRIASDFEGLKESQDMAYSSDNITNYNGNIVCKETKNGTVKDLRISGKSFNNLMPNPTGKWYNNLDSAIAYCSPRFNTLNFKPNTLYTAILFNVPSNFRAFRLYTLADPDRDITSTIGTFTTRSDLSLAKEMFHIYAQSGTTWSMEELNKIRIVILEGDHTQSPPNTYFEGIASVGNGVDKIEVSSMNNGNILNSELIKASVSAGNGHLGSINVPNGNITQLEIMPVIPNMPLYYKSTGERTFRSGGNTFVYKYGKNNEFLGREGTVTFEPINIPSDCYGVRVVFSDFELSKDYPADKYGVVFSQFENFVDTPVKQDKKTILFKDTDGTWKPISELRGLDTVCDTIELYNDGKYYYHQRTASKVLTGGEGEDWRRLGSLDTTNTERYALYVDDVCINGKIISNRFKYAYQGGDDMSTCIYIHNVDKRIDIKKLKTDNLWTDLVTFKEWLKANNLVIIYQLAEEKVFEVNPLFLEAYASETMMSINSGLINAHMEFKLTSSLPNLVSLNQKRIKELENQMVTMFKSVLNGDMRTLAETIYPEDFTKENIPMLLI